MAREHTPQLDADGINLIGRLFTIDLAREIAERVGTGLPPVPDPDFLDPALDADPEDMVFAQLAQQLADAAVNWGFAVYEQTGASLDMKVKLARKVKTDCARLLARMTDDDGALLQSLGPGGLWALAALQGGSGSAQVSRAMTAVRDLERWAGGMVNRIEAVEGVRPVPESETAFNALLGELGRIYEVFWRRAPSYSRPQEEPGGPFYRFVRAVIEQLDLRKSDEALASAIAKHPQLTEQRRVHAKRPWQ